MHRFFLLQFVKLVKLWVWWVLYSPRAIIVMNAQGPPMKARKDNDP